MGVKEVDMGQVERKGVVSLWAFRERENPEDVDKDVLSDFLGVESYDNDSQEGCVSDEESPLVDLIRQISYSETFVAEAVAAARELGVEKAYGVIAQYDFAYDPVNVHKPVRNDPVFLGYFPWHD